MSPERSGSLDSQLASLDAAGTVDLCKTLGEYAEAGGLSRELMSRVGSYSANKFPDHLDVQLGVARLYHLGGDLDRAREALLRAGKLAPDDARVVQLLGQVLREQGSAAADDEAPRSTGRMAVMPPVSKVAAAPPAQAVKATPTPATPVDMATQPTIRRRETPRAPTRIVTPPPRRPSRAVLQPVTSRDSPRSPEVARFPESLRSPEVARLPEASLTPVPPTVEGSPLPEGVKPRSSRIRLLAPDDPRRRLDRYELIGEIASGGMASVFLARRDGVGGFQRLVAIKRLHPHFAREEEFVGMFLDEARLAASIHNPHVVPILDIGENAEGAHYLVMEFVEGETLAGLSARALARGVVLPRSVALRIVLDTLAGLHAAHQLKNAEGQLIGLVHRDCTPQNILVGTDGSSRVTDFGVARAAGRIAMTGKQIVKGKVAYLSPEQATAGELDRRSDLFTVGIMLWEVLAGRSLFLSDIDAVTISRVLTAQVPSIRQFVPEVPPAIDEVCQRALQRAVGRRFTTAAAMAEALEMAARSSSFAIASPSDVGRCVETLMGPDLTAQRETVRSWLAQHTVDASPTSRRRAEAAALAGALVEIMPVTPVAAPSKPSLPAEPPPAAEPAPAPATPREEAPKVPAPAEAPAAQAPPRSRRTLVTVALIVAVGALSPLWMRALNHGRPPGAQDGGPRPPRSPRAHATADPGQE